MEKPSTAGKKFGLGRNLPQPRLHCERCKDITAKADQMVSNYVMMNYRQLQSITRLLSDPESATEITYLNEQLAERDAALMYAASVLRRYDADSAESLMENVFTKDGRPKEWVNTPDIDRVEN